MAVHIATIGWDHPSRIMPSLLEAGRPDRVYLICSNSNQGRDKEVGATIGTFIQDRLRDLHIQCEVLKVDPMDANDILRTLMSIDLQDAPIHLNITGGTKIMVIAAMMYAMMSQRVEKVYYAKAEDYGTPLRKERITLDRLDSIPQEHFISWGYAGTVVIPNLGVVPQAGEKTASRVLLRLQRNRYDSVGELTREIAESEHVSVNTVRDRLNDLRRANLVTVSHEGKYARPSLSDTGRQLADLLRAKQDAGAA
jgi:DNA-binding transcriptional ArsR family regulator